MAEKRGKGCRTAIEVHSPADPSVSDPQLARTRIRQRWELASVLNFVHVFRPLVGRDLKISAEEIETALITPNEDLARVHVALLKGIPPVNKNMTNGDAWVTVVCKKLASWWPWVAEGENPLKVDHGKEIQKYKALDPVVRIAILKALCEVRAQQDDVCSYIGDELKKGTNITTFRKERIGGIGNAVSYWYEGDPVIGHRLYKEIIQVESKPKPKGKGRATGLINDYQWETLATELEEFQKISDNLSSSKVNTEAAVGEIIKTEIVPVLLELQKKKERAWKRQQREALELNDFLNYSRVGSIRSCRERRPVCYTFDYFDSCQDSSENSCKKVTASLKEEETLQCNTMGLDEYDRSIDEAIEICKKTKETGSMDKFKKTESISHGKQAMETDTVDQGSSETDEIHESMADVEYIKGHENNNEDDEYGEKDEENPNQSDNDQDDDYYDEKDEDRGESSFEEEEEEGRGDHDDYTSSDAGKDDSPKLSRNQTEAGVGLRRSDIFVEHNKGPAETKKRLRQRPTHNSSQIVSDSEDSSQENEKQTEVVSDSEMEESVALDERSPEDANKDSSDASD